MTAVARPPYLAWEFPYAVGMVKSKNDKKKKKNLFALEKEGGGGMGQGVKKCWMFI